MIEKIILPRGTEIKLKFGRKYVEHITDNDYKANVYRETKTKYYFTYTETGYSVYEGFVEKKNLKQYTGSLPLSKLKYPWSVSGKPVFLKQ